MVANKYIKPLILSIALNSFMIIGFSIGMARDPSYYKTLPLLSAGFQLALVFLLIILSAFIGILFGYILGPFFLLVHKKIIGRKMLYGIQEKSEPEQFKEYFKAFFPSLMAINFALLFSIEDFVMNIMILNRDEGFPPLIAFVGLLPLMIGISFALFSPVWFLLDAGIVYTNKEKVKNKRYPIEVRSVGGWYMYLLKGYAGIAVIIAYYVFIITVIEAYGAKLHPSTPISLIPFPILLSLMLLIVIIALELTVDHRKRFILKFADKLGINTPLEEPLDIKS